MSKIKSDYYVWIYVMVMCFVLILCVSNKTCLAKSKSVKCDTKLLNRDVNIQAPDLRLHQFPKKVKSRRIREESV